MMIAQPTKQISTSRLLGAVAEGKAWSVVSLLALSLLLAYFLFFLWNQFLLMWIPGSLQPPNAIPQGQRSKTIPAGQRRRSAERVVIQRLPTLGWSQNESTVLNEKSFVGNALPVPSTTMDNRDDWPATLFLPGIGSQRYRIYKETLDSEGQASSHAEVALLEVRCVKSGAGLSVLTDVALWSGSDWQRVPWWQIGDLAPSNELLSLRGTTLLRLDFPTNTTALTSWFKEHWADFTRSSGLEDYGPGGLRYLKGSALESFLAPGLSRVFREDFGHLQKNTPIVLARMSNGWVQWLTLGGFLAALSLMFARWWVFVRAEQRHDLDFTATAAQQAGSSVDGMEAEGETGFWERAIEAIELRQAEHELRWGKGIPSISLSIWRGALSAIRRAGDYGDVPSFLESFSQLEEDRLLTRAAALRFFIGALPALGFIGTILGIGNALMGTGAVLSDELAKQQSGVAEVALALGLAFDTTLLALVLSLIVLFLSSQLGAAEEAVIQRARAICLEVFVHRGESLSKAKGFQEQTQTLVLFEQQRKRELEQENEELEQQAQQVRLPASQPDQTLQFQDGPEDYSSILGREQRWFEPVLVLLLLLLYGALAIWWKLSG